MRNNLKSQPSTRNPQISPVRCAIYTRKSTEDGLEQEFNSLDAQRLAGEMYVGSQASEGWVALPERYDDGGFTGGNMDRPALKRLMDDITAKRVDCVVVYKVDRLSRSLLDFTRIMDAFDSAGVAFVSVTQQFNTGNSMGRLMLNVLLSFAQFEREMISERTRDKIAATRRKGQWTGGCPVLGYDIAKGGGRLIVNPEEAERVRMIYQTYLEQQSIRATIEAIGARGWTTKRWRAKTGRMMGGRPFVKNTLSKLLNNRLYLGLIGHAGKFYEARHEAIVDQDLFDKVQKLLRDNLATGGARLRNRHGVLLKGIVRCRSCDCPMVPSHTLKRLGSKGSKVYRYYCCSNAQRHGWDKCPVPSVPAPELERFVFNEIREIGRDPGLVSEVLNEVGRQAGEAAATLENERRSLTRELAMHNDALARLIGKPGSDAAMADIQDRITQAERRITEINEERLALSQALVTEDEVAQACKRMDELWETLDAREQARLMHLLVERVDFYGERGSVAITFRQAGISEIMED